MVTLARVISSEYAGETCASGVDESLNWAYTVLVPWLPAKEQLELVVEYVSQVDHVEPSLLQRISREPTPKLEAQRFKVTVEDTVLDAPLFIEIEPGIGRGKA